MALVIPGIRKSVIYGVRLHGAFPVYSRFPGRIAANGVPVPHGRCTERRYCLFCAMFSHWERPEEHHTCSQSIYDWGKQLRPE